MYIQTPCGRGPGQEALSREGSNYPLAGRGVLEQSLRVLYPQGEGTQLPALPLFSHPKLEGC